MLALAAMLALTAATDPRVELLRADSLWRAGIASGGFVPATAARLAPDAVLVWPGAPVIERAETIGRFLAAQPGLDSLALGWSPERSWLSAAGDFGVVYGRTTSGRAGGPRGLVLAAWARDGREWRLAALLLVGIGAPAGAVLPQGMGPLTHPAVAGAGRLQPLADADLAFAADAGRRGAAAAFEAWAAPDAVILGGPEPTLGPAAIGRAFAARPASRWTWHPVAVRGSAAGDLGITVGEAIITPDAQPDAPNYSKYLTVWARQPDGSVRYLTDGGNPRPRP
jgi:hypothetical protein